MVNKTGSRYEKESEIGISHFLEHLCLGFAKNPSYDKLVSGATFYEHTHYRIRVETAEEIPVGLATLEQILSGKIINPEQVNEIREDVVSEWNGNYQSESYYIRKAVFDELFHKDLVSRFPIGRYENIINLDLNELLAYHKKFYATNSSAIMCFGNFELLDVEKQIISTFGNLKESRSHTFKSYIGELACESKYTIKFSPVSLKQIKGEIYCLLVINYK
ncbi:MAG: insulinase family protein [Lachnospiraceae bacterium]|nr:insulinase family protein [Lachnospiraceae bacterium]MDE7205312.1 insulinase family protein [Lachnospiraceae bacterium]